MEFVKWSQKMYMKYSVYYSPPFQDKIHSILTLNSMYWFFRWCLVKAPNSNTLAWKVPWMEEPGRLQSMGSQRDCHDWATSLSLFAFMHWRRKWQPTPVFLPGESQERWSLVGCHLWGCTESDTTEATWQQAAAATFKKNNTWKIRS